MSEPWNGIPDDPHESGWHWIGYPNAMEPAYWHAECQAWGDQESGEHPYSGGPELEYLGPVIPPISRCRDGRRKFATAAAFEFEYDSIRIRMNDGDDYHMDGYYWRNDQPVFDVIGKTIPELIAAARQYRDPAPEGDDE